MMKRPRARQMDTEGERERARGRTQERRKEGREGLYRSVVDGRGERAKTEHHDAGFLVGRKEKSSRVGGG